MTSDDSADFDLDETPAAEIARAPLPAPPVPPDADLRGFRRMPLDVVALRGSTLWTKGTDAQRIASLNLFFAAWHQVPAGSLPDDPRVLCRLAECTPQAFARWGKSFLLRGWCLASDGRLYHRFLVDIVLSSLDTLNARRKGGRRRHGLDNKQNLSSSSSTQASAQASAHVQQGNGKERIIPLPLRSRSSGTNPRAQAAQSSMPSLTFDQATAAIEAALYFAQPNQSGNWIPATNRQKAVWVSLNGAPPGSAGSKYSAELAAIALQSQGFKLVDGFAVRINGHAPEIAAGPENPA